MLEKKLHFISTNVPWNVKASLSSIGQVWGPEGLKLWLWAGNRKAGENVVWCWNILSQKQKNNSVVRLRMCFARSWCDASSFLFQASVKSWSCDSSWMCPFWELIQWRSEALSDHGFTVQLKYTGNESAKAADYQPTASRSGILALTQKVTEVGKKTIKCLTTRLSLCRCTYQKG